MDIGRMFLKCFVAAWMVLFSGSLFSQGRFDQRSFDTGFERELSYNGQGTNERLLYNPWKLNLDYAIELKKNFRCSLLTLNNLARAAESINEHNNEALECVNSLLVKNEPSSEVKSDFEAITAQANGAVRWHPGKTANPLDDRKLWE
jgi:hypothetical protein